MARQSRKLLRQAHQSGLLDPLLEELDRRIKKSGAPIEPAGAEWPLKRAYCDGRSAEAEEIRAWLVRAINSTDGSENTEESDE